MTNPVILIVPIVNFNSDRSPPTDGNSTTEKITIMGPDYTQINIPAGAIYNNNAKSNYQMMFTSSEEMDNPFIIEFPKNTIHNSQESGKYSDVFITPSKIYYSFENTNSIQKNSANTVVKVVSGTINIATDDVTNVTTDVTGVNASFDTVNNATGVNIDDLDGGYDKHIYDNFSSKILTLIYTLLKDFLVILAIWVIVITIGIWGQETANDIHPTDVSKFPYVEGKAGDIDLSSIGTGKGVFCKVSDEPDKFVINPHMGGGESPLKYINPIMVDKNKENIYYTAKLIQSSCSNTSNQSDAFSVFMYWINYVIFNQVLYQNFTLNTLHKILNGLTSGVVSVFKSSQIMSSIALAILIYTISISTIPIIETIRGYSSNNSKNILNKLNVTGNIIEKPEDIIVYGLINLLSLLVIIGAPLFVLLFLVGLMVHIWSMYKIMVESLSVECAILSAIALMTTVVGLFKVIGSIVDRDSIWVVDSIGSISFSGLFKFISMSIGLYIPLAFALYGAFSIPGRILFSSFFLIKEKIEELSNLSYALMLLLFLFLLKDVNNILGHAHVFITIAVIGFFGLLTTLKT